MTVWRRAALLVGAALCLPFVVAAALTVMVQRPPVHLNLLAGWMIVLGPALAFMLNLAVVAHLNFQRRDGETECRLTLSGSLFQLGVILVSFLLAAAFAAHVAADAYACMNGVSRAC